MMSKKKKLMAFGGSVGLAISLALFGAASSNAVELGIESFEGSSISAPLYFGGFNADIASQNGYELRVDAEGAQYIAPISATPDDMSNAHYLPRPVDENGDLVGEVSQRTLNGEIRPNGIVTGDCGSSGIFFEGSGTYSTSYSFNKPGGTFSHTWIVTGVSSSGAKNYNLSGLAPFGGAGWVSGLKYFSQPGYVTFANVSTGVAYGVLGYVCYSGNPSAVR